MSTPSPAAPIPKRATLMTILLCITQNAKALHKRGSSRGWSWPNCNKDYEFYLTRMESMSSQFFDWSESKRRRLAIIEGHIPSTGIMTTTGLWTVEVRY
jgi:hypothetical protein